MFPNLTKQLEKDYSSFFSSPKQKIFDQKVVNAEKELNNKTLVYRIKRNK